MTRPIPVLSDYDISPSHGFLAPETPALRHPYYAKWEEVVRDLDALLQAKKLRQTIGHLPVLSIDYLETPAEWRRAYVCLTFMLNGYVWGEEEPEHRIPPPLTVPLLEVCRHWELPPIATYAGLCLWNYQHPVQGLPCPQPEDLAVSCTFTGTADEQWFYLISVAFEARGAPVISLMLDAIAAARTSDTVQVTHALQRFAQHLEALTTLLDRMHERCAPRIFYHRIRPFLAGSKALGSGGLVYEDGATPAEVGQGYAGGSNAQSSLIQFLDLVLGIAHPSSSSSSSSTSSTGDSGFIADMRAYMPGPHRRFLEHVAQIANIRAFVEERGDPVSELRAAYNACIDRMCVMRNVHLRMVARYIITPSRSAGAGAGADAQQQQQQQQQRGGSSATPFPASPSQKKTVRGTGGTELIPFLSQIRNETSRSRLPALASARSRSSSLWIAEPAARGAARRSQERNQLATPVWLTPWMGWVEGGSGGGSGGLHYYLLVLTASMAATGLGVLGYRTLELIVSGF